MYNSVCHLRSLRTSLRTPRTLYAKAQAFFGPERVSGTYSDLLKDIDSGRVYEAHMPQTGATIHYKQTPGDESTEREVVLPRQNEVLDSLVSHDIPVYIENGSQNAAAHFLDVFAYIFQLVFFIVIANVLFKGIFGGGVGGQGNGSPFTFGKSKAVEVDPSDSKVRFSDVAGVEAAKHDLVEVVDFLKNPERYTALGAKVPRGVLLVGPPGTGKTLLAKAVAGEAEVPFFYCSASSFMEMFVGTGAARVRDLFEKAKAKAPCIIFIDEIDAVGRARGAGGMSGGGNDERDQTINQLLTVMDGFQENSGVIVLAATNRPDILDDALLRPGRFDRKVNVELPDFAGRLAILKIHTNGKPVDPSVDLDSMARTTVGFSGADLANLANEAAIYAARDKATAITTAHWDRALEKVTIGEERPTMLVTEKKRRLVAYHEAGHALLGMLVDDFDPIRKVTIVPRGNTGGVTYFQPDDERVDSGLVSRKFLENQIIVSLGGRVAEEIVFGTTNVSTGAAGDFQAVASIAFDMIASYGFSEELGPIGWSSSHVDVTGEIASEMRFLVETCYRRASDLMREYEFYLHRIAEALLEKETLTEEDLKNATDGLSCPRKVGEHSMSASYEEELMNSVPASLLGLHDYDGTDAV